MYKGNNKTAIASQDMISQALLKLLQYKSFFNISISELCKEAQISRQTFYSLFKSKENVILYQIENKYKFTLDLFADKEHLTLQDLCYCYNLYMNNNMDYIKMLIDNNLSQTLYKGFYNGFISCRRIIPEKYESMREFIAVFVAHGLTSIAKTYVLNGLPEGIDSLDDMIYLLFSGKYFNY